LLIWVDAYTFFVYQPAWLVALFAGLARRWWLLGAAGVVVALHLAWVLPDYRPAQSIPAEAQSAPRITLMTENVYFGNPDYSAISAEIGAVDPDVLFLQEFSQRLEVQLRADGIEDRYPYRHTALENRYYGVALYSKLPLGDVSVVEGGGRPYIRATVQVGDQTVTLYDLHPTSPGFGRNVAANWNNGWEAISTALDAEPGLVIAAGDLNMDQHHRWYHKLKSIGFVESHEERGRGSATTWPQGRKLRRIRIDHVFHSKGIVCLSIREGRGQGSDHKPVIAVLAIVP
jgi:endonuclease/exonuclease/phosphatase (EEP) superfamily protein YafD